MKFLSFASPLFIFTCLAAAKPAAAADGIHSLLMIISGGLSYACGRTHNTAVCATMAGSWLVTLASAQAMGGSTNQAPGLLVSEQAAERTQPTWSMVAKAFAPAIDRLGEESFAQTFCEARVGTRVELC